MASNDSDLAPIVMDDQTGSEVSISKGFKDNQKFRHGITMFVLFLINLLNFMDRFAIAGVLDKIKDDFKISDGQAGFLQTVFICSYMVLAPLFGFLGDRFSRKWLMLLGLGIWSLMTLAGSFVPSDMFSVFVLLRCLVGIGEASYSCVATTIIADIYKDDMRTKMLAVFNIATPLGSGLGYIVGAYVAKAFNNNWRWALRVTPVLGAVCILLLVFLVEEPKRGAADGVETFKRSKWIHDVKQIFQVKTFIGITLGFTWVSFALGALAWWGPIFIQKAYILRGDNSDEMKANVSLYFGIVACVAGIVGVVVGTEVARRYRKRNERADPIVCGVAILIAVPFMIGVLLLSKDNIIVTWIFALVAETLLCTNWALISDMLLYIIVPSRRSTASAIQIFILHLLGDASSPAIVGQVSDFFREGSNDTYVEWSSLRNALLITPCVSAMGGVAFLLAAICIIDDRRQAKSEMNFFDASTGFDMTTSVKN